MNLKRPGCLSKGPIMHEFGHVLGLAHEHQRPIRDTFIDTHEENIVDEKKFAFAKVDVTSYVSEKYDFKSIMHYSPYAFSENGKKVMTPKPEFSDQEVYMGYHDYPSSLDRLVIEEIYGRRENIADNVKVIDSDTGKTVDYKPLTTNETKVIYRGHRSGNGHMWGRSQTELTNYGYAVDGEAFSVFKTPGAGRIGLYSCTFGSNRYFITTNSKCNGETLVGNLGYAYTSSSRLAPSLLYDCYNGYSHLIVKDTSECAKSNFGTIVPLNVYLP